MFERFEAPTCLRGAGRGAGRRSGRGVATFFAAFGAIVVGLALRVATFRTVPARAGERASNPGIVVAVPCLALMEVCSAEVRLVAFSLLVVGYASVLFAIANACIGAGLPIGQCLQDR